MSPLFTGLFDRLLARRPKDFEPTIVVAAEPGEAAEGRVADREPCSDRALLEWLDDEDERHAEIAWVCDRSKDGMGVKSPYRLEPGWAVLVTFSEEAPVKAMVRHCEADQSDWRAGLMVIRSERRRHDRSLARGQVTVVWQGPSQGRRESRAHILDISEGGVGLSGEAAVPKQSTVCVIHDGWQRFGTVAHGRPEGERYVFGIQFAGPPRPINTPDPED